MRYSAKEIQQAVPLVILVKHFLIQGGTRNSAAFIIATLELVPQKPADTGSATCHV